MSQITKRIIFELKVREGFQEIIWAWIRSRIGCCQLLNGKSVCIRECPTVFEILSVLELLMLKKEGGGQGWLMSMFQKFNEQLNKNDKSSVEDQKFATFCRKQKISWFVFGRQSFGFVFLQNQNKKNKTSKTPLGNETKSDYLLTLTPGSLIGSFRNTKIPQ